MRILPSLALAVLVPAGLLAAEEVNRIILRVNDRIATLQDYETMRSERLRAILQAPNLEEDQREELLKEVPNRVFRDLMNELLILSRADQLAISVLEDDVDAALQRMRERSGLETDEALQAALAQSGLTLSQVRKNIRQQLLYEQVVGDEVASRISLEEEDLRRYYREHPEEFRIPEQQLVAEIVVLESGVPDPQERASIAEEIFKELSAGESLGKMAERYAPEEITSQIIEHGWISPGDLDPVLEEAVWNVEVGDYTPPVEGRGGLHILEVQDRKPASMQPFSEVQDRIAARERSRLFDKEIEAYLEELELKSYVRLDPPEEARQFRSIAPSIPGEEGAMMLETAASGETGVEILDVENATDEQPEEAESASTPP